MPKMTHPNQPRPLSVQAEDVAAHEADGWSLVNAAPAKSDAPAKTATKKAVTRKSAK